MRKTLWLIIAWLAWPLYRLGWRRPYGIASGKYTQALFDEGRI
jgi:hypothetical protein